MASEISRRKFISNVGLTVGGLSLAPFLLAQTVTGSMVPGMKLGYSAITWAGNDLQAIKDISSLGFKGIQLRSTILKEYGSKPMEIRSLLIEH